MTPFVFEVLADDPHLGLCAGDRLVVDPGDQEPVQLQRQLPPNYGAILGLAEQGVLRLVTPMRRLDDLRQAVGAPSSSPVRPARARRRPGRVLPFRPRP
jgi:hypothetical protein